MDRIGISEVLDTGSIPVSGSIITKLPEYKFDFERIKLDALKILYRFNLLQIGLTHSPKTESGSITDRILECTGSAYDFGKKKYKFKETDFSIFNEEFKSSSLYEMYKSIPNIGRFRIMTMDGPACYTIHSDSTMRYHYVLETNENCLFLFPDDKEMYHIPADQCLYIADTRRKHTFVNGSRGRRIHLVLDDLSTLLKTE